MERPTVDILMATFNGERFLREQLDSILIQTYENFRLLIHDDASIDETVSILMEYKQKDSRIEIYLNDSNRGAVRTFEMLLAQSSAPLFMFSDQDDKWHRNKVEKSVTKFQMKSGTWMVYSDLRIVDKNLKVLDESFMKSNGYRPISSSYLNTLLIQQMIPGCSILGSEELRKRSLPFPKEVSMHDAWLCIVAGIYGEIQFLDLPLIDYRQHASNTIGALTSIQRWNSLTNLTWIDFKSSRSDFYRSEIKKMVSYHDFLSTDKNKQKTYLMREIVEYYTFFHYNLNPLKAIRKSIEFKSRYTSDGTARNLWWFFYHSFPFLCYSSLKVIGFVRKVFSYFRRAFS
ncbi:Glycosyl transferase family 2 [Paenibacillaceae bacterium GAS479]|nr:Glycosyl transferase family 2 [Paenibacillaceae bacterium GAS479]